MISVDDPQTNKEFAESLNTTFPLLSNPERTWRGRTAS